MVSGKIGSPVTSGNDPISTFPLSVLSHEGSNSDSKEAESLVILFKMVDIPIRQTEKECYNTLPSKSKCHVRSGRLLHIVLHGAFGRPKIS